MNPIHHILEFKLEWPESWPIKQGMTREQVKGILRSVPSVFTKNPNYSTVPTDAFEKMGVHVYYNDNNKVEGVEIFNSENKNAVILKGENLFGLTMKELYESTKGLEGFQLELGVHEAQLRTSNRSFEVRLDFSFDVHSEPKAESIYIDMKKFKAKTSYEP